MKTPFEQIQNDEGSSFRLLHQKVAANDFSWSYHYHPEFELVLVFGGSGRRHVGNHLSYYDDGDLVLIGSNLPHAGFGYAALGEHEEIVIQFRENFLGENFFDKPEMFPIKKLFESSQQGVQFYGGTYQNVRAKLKNLLSMSYFERLVALLNIFYDLAISKEQNLLNSQDTRYDFGQKDQIRLRKIYTYVEQSYQNPINMAEVASVANLTVPSFCNYFKKVVNQTYTDFVNEYRINRACQLLMTELSIIDVCFACGFTNNSYFSKVFKAIKGKSPLEFKKLVLRK